MIQTLKLLSSKPTKKFRSQVKKETFDGPVRFSWGKRSRGIVAAYSVTPLYHFLILKPTWKTDFKTILMKTFICDPKSLAFFLYFFFQEAKIELKKSVKFPWKWCQLLFFFCSSGKFLDLVIV